MNKSLIKIKKYLETAGDYVEACEIITKKVKDNSGSQDLKELRKSIQKVKDKFSKKGK